MALHPNLLACGVAAVMAALPLPPATASRFDVRSFNALVETFRSHGFEVVGSHERCLREPNLYGLYIRGSRRIVVCPRGNQLDTLMHEGWHAVQARCRRGAPLLSTDYLRANLPRADLRDIDALYSPKSWHREAEARAMALQRMPLYLAHLESSCGRPAQPGGPAAGPATATTASPAAAPPAHGTAAPPQQRSPAPAPTPAGTLQRLLPVLLP